MRVMQSIQDEILPEESTLDYAMEVLKFNRGDPIAGTLIGPDHSGISVLETWLLNNV